MAEVVTVTLPSGSKVTCTAELAERLGVKLAVAAKKAAPKTDAK